MGSLIYVYDGKGGVVIEDTRTLQEAKDQRKKDIQQMATQLITEAGATELRQRNVGLGIITGDEADKIRAIVQHYRLQCQAKENDIDASNTNEKVDSIDFSYLPY